MSHFDENLTPVLSLASNADLEPLVEYISKASLSETLTNNDLYKKHTPNHKEYVELVEREIRKFGGNTFLNIFRDNGPQYFDIVCDVASKLGANYNKKSSIDEVESAIMMRIMSQAWEKMTNQERQEFLNSMELGTGIESLPKALPVVALQIAIKASGFLAYKLAIIVANAIARAILGRGLAFATGATLTRGIAVFAGPIGWVITGIWTLLDLAGPAYRVTIPCVVHIAMLRQQYSLMHCPECSAPYTDGAKFCQNCGTRIETV